MWLFSELTVWLRPLFPGCLELCWYFEYAGRLYLRWIESDLNFCYIIMYDFRPSRNKFLKRQRVVLSASNILAALIEIELTVLDKSTIGTWLRACVLRK